MRNGVWIVAFAGRAGVKTGASVGYSLVYTLYITHSLLLMFIGFRCYVQGTLLFRCSDHSLLEFKLLLRVVHCSGRSFLTRSSARSCLLIQRKVTLRLPLPHTST
jgi:hypothetical protein